jgi:protein-disulfide isomerase
MTPTRETILMAGAVLALLWGHAPAYAQPAQGAKSTTPAAKVRDEVITLEEVEGALKSQLAAIESQRFALIEGKLDQLIGERVLAQEAKNRRISVEQLLQVEVYAKAPAVTDAEVRSFIIQNRARLPQADESELTPKVREYLRGQKMEERRQAYVENLRARSKVAVYLETPVTARVPVSTDRGFVRGAKDARVVIVEFSDFQCPFCQSVTATLKQLLDKYPGKVKWVFRDFPISNLHPAAPKAHEAARCAAEQGKFWEYHDMLFEKSPHQAPEDLKQYAKYLGLDTTSFARCLDSGKQQAEVSRDLQDGASLGVAETPTFFINGRRLLGAQPLTAFRKVVDSELARKTQ